MKHQEGFTLIEIALGVLIVLIVAMAVAPVFSQNLLLQEVQWDRKLATRVVETQLEKACNAAETAAGFDALAPQDPLPASEFPPKLANATGTREVSLLDPNLKQVRVTVNWTSRGRDMREPSADYLISRIGACGTGA